MGYVILTIIVTILLAFIPSSIAGKKGYSSVGFFFFGLAAFIPALIVACCLHDITYDQRYVAVERSDARRPVPANIQQAKPLNPLIQRAYLSMEDRDWDKADEFLERVLDAEPENAYAYVGKLCVELRINKETDLFEYESPINHLANYKRAYQFADNSYKKKLEAYAVTPAERAEQGTHKEMDKIKKDMRLQEYRDYQNRINEARSNRDINEYMMLVEGIAQFSDIINADDEARKLTRPSYNGDLTICPFCKKFAAT